MIKIAFMGAGSSVFAKKILGDCMLSPVMRESEMALYDIDPQRLEDSRKMLEAIRHNLHVNTEIKCYLGIENRKDALRNASYVINAIQVGLYRPCTVTDFEVPKKYGLRQTIGDTLGIGGIFRALRTIPVMMDFAKDMEEVCPDAWFFNYTNPMCMLTGAMLRYTGIRTIGLCHSVQKCVPRLFKDLGLPYDEKLKWKIAGINHQAWLLSIEDPEGNDLYPEIKRRAFAKTEKHEDMVRYEIMKRFGYYTTESSEHLSEYVPYFIKSKYPELIEQYNIPLDEYPRRCENYLEAWKTLEKELINNPDLTHEKSLEYACDMMESMETGHPMRMNGNVLNTGLIPNLPSNAVVEVPCLVDGNGITPTYVGDLPEQCAALNRTNINVQLMTIEAAMTRKKEAIYQAALLDPHCQSELSIDDIIKLCDDLIEQHGVWLPEYQ